MQRFSPNFCCGSQILLFHMCFGIRILSTFYLATQIVSILNLKWPKTVKTQARTWFLEWTSIHVKCSSIFAKFSSLNVEFIPHPYQRSPILIICLLRKVKFKESIVINCMNIIRIKFNFLIAEPWLPSSTWSGDKNHVRACGFSVFRAVKILMDTIWVARWNGLKILIPKHMWKSKIWLVEQKL